MIDVKTVLDELKKTDPKGFIIESHFQVRFGYALSNLYGAYQIEFEKHIGKNRVDIVATKGDEKIGFEFKYFTKEEEIQFTDNLKIKLKNQSSRDLHRIGFWKDVAKLESLISNGFLTKGFSIMLSNDKVLFEDTENKDADFSIADGVRPGKTKLRHKSGNTKHDVDLIKDDYVLKNEPYFGNFKILIVPIM